MTLLVVDPNNPLPLVYPDLIEWTQISTPNILTFANDEAIVNFLCANNPNTASRHELNSEVSIQGGVKFSNCKMRKIKERSDGENHSMAISDQEKVKTKSIWNGENLSEAPEDGRFDTLPEHFQERSKFLIEPTQSINIGDTEQVRTLHLAESLTEQEKSNFIKFFEEQQINFAWSYADMLGIDLDLIMHHLSLPSRIKPEKQKL